MSFTVWLAARTLQFSSTGGHFWFHLNWALGLRSLGCKVIWLEPVMPDKPSDEIQAMLSILKSRLAPYGLANSVALCSCTDEPLPAAATSGCMDLDIITEADLLLNMVYGLHPDIVSRFRRSALLDTDPGLTQFWISRGYIKVAPHDVYFTIGETVGRPEAMFTDCGLDWHYTPLCVALDHWPEHPAPDGAPFTTVSHWYMDEWMEDEGTWYQNDKRSGFLPFLGLPRYTSQSLELVLRLAGLDAERVKLRQQGWSVRESYETVPTPRSFQRYIQESRGEFSCAKPSYVRMQTAWLSDRTLCYLASGKPAVVQHTGTSRFLPDSAGLFRFRDIKEAALCLEKAASDYDRQCRYARVLAEEYFDAPKVVRNVLEIALA